MSLRERAGAAGHRAADRHREPLHEHRLPRAQNPADQSIRAAAQLLQRLTHRSRAPAALEIRFAPSGGPSTDRTQADRLQGAIDDLLDISRIQSGPDPDVAAESTDRIWRADRQRPGQRAFPDEPPPAGSTLIAPDATFQVSWDTDAASTRFCPEPARATRSSTRRVKRRSMCACARRAPTWSWKCRTMASASLNPRSTRSSTPSRAVATPALSIRPALASAFSSAPRSRNSTAADRRHQRRRPRQYLPRASAGGDERGRAREQGTGKVGATSPPGPLSREERGSRNDQVSHPLPCSLPSPRGRGGRGVR